MQNIVQHSFQGLLKLAGMVALAGILATATQAQPPSISSLESNGNPDRPLALADAFPYFLSINGSRIRDKNADGGSDNGPGSGLNGDSDKEPGGGLNGGLDSELSGRSDSSLSVTWTPAPGHYLYRHGFAFSLLEHADAEPKPLAFSLPDGLKSTDQFFGEIEAYHASVTAQVQVDSSAMADSSLIIEYQGCAEWGFCYPPQRVILPLWATAKSPPAL